MNIDKQPNKNSRGFQPGKSGNPKGRPKTAKCIPDILREIGDRPVDPWLLSKLREKYGPNHTPKNMREALLMSAYFDASNGDRDAAKFIVERTEGRVADTLNFNDQTPCRVQFVEVRQRIIPGREPK